MGHAKKKNLVLGKVTNTTERKNRQKKENGGGRGANPHNRGTDGRAGHPRDRTCVKQGKILKPFDNQINATVTDQHASSRGGGGGKKKTERKERKKVGKQTRDLHTGYFNQNPQRGGEREFRPKAQGWTGELATKEGRNQ